MIILVVLALTLGIFVSATHSLEQERFVFEIEHSFGSSFSPRGKLTVQQTPDGRLVAETGKNVIENEEIDDFKTLLAVNGFYRVRIRQTDSNRSVSAAIPSVDIFFRPAHKYLYLFFAFKCELQKSGFKEDIIVHLNNNNDLVGLSYSSPVIALSRPCDPSKVVPTYMILQNRLKR